MDYLFSQSMLSRISGYSASTISRMINSIRSKELDQSLVRNKKCTFAESRAIMKELIADNYDVEKRVQVFFNFKGGTGKTSLCHQMSVHMSLLGFKVLVIDCDPQAHLSYVLGFNEGGESVTLYDVLVNKLPIREAICTLDAGLDVIPANLSLTRVELPLSQSTNREKLLKKVIAPLEKDYDFIFLDTNPTISILNQNTTYCADVVNIVCETRPFSLKGMEMLVTELEDFSTAMEKKIEYVVIPNKYESKTGTSQEVLGSLRYEYGDKVMESIVRRSEDMNISAKKRIPVCAFAKKGSIAFEDMCDLSLSMMNKSAKRKVVEK